ncbi:head completion/stabilization protein [Pseudoxanthomonas wuyuanensis]|uniref:Phage head completion protein (GPL) n=1 Tax=Pseudoxanthomonas wuyuanensis TaxID=1073196 RepID=A0A286D4W4_9GAMM|nr:head completion/stabilization protein [Pseudoxanthomonas wuyuanensis]KAF1719812.1 head completion/stabilization protein [Pseudoxanthomonas wuyuanensis]SOD53691.1 Phage head completion protein (GPL) [Pseudoxanthomonas wuyuanensis]
MSGFIANGTTAPATDIANGPFWPPVKPDEIRARMRLDGAIAAERLRAAVVAAMMMVNDDLADWRATQHAAGYGTLADVPTEAVDGTSRLVQLYQRAIACCAAAELTERYRSFDASDSANQRADDLTPSIDELRRDQRWAIRDLKGQSRVTVELI